MKKTRKKVKFDLTKLDPNFIELARDYFETEEFGLLRNKYGNKKSLYFKYENIVMDYMLYSMNKIEEDMTHIVTLYESSEKSTNESNLDFLIELTDSIYLTKSLFTNENNSKHDNYTLPTSCSDTSMHYAY